jgi:hypothetical protein
MIFIVQFLNSKFIPVIDVHNYIGLYFTLILVYLSSKNVKNYCYLATIFAIVGKVSTKGAVKIKYNGMVLIELPYPPFLEEMVAHSKMLRFQIAEMFYNISANLWFNAINLIIQLLKYEKVLKKPRGTLMSFDESNPTIVLIVDDRMLFRQELQSWIHSGIYDGSLKEAGIEVIGTANHLLISNEKYAFLQGKVNLLPPFPEMQFSHQTDVIATIINCQTHISGEIFMQVFGTPHVNNILVVLLPKLGTQNVHLYIDLTHFFVMTSFTLKQAYEISWMFSAAI